MKNRRELFDHFAKLNIYLNKWWLYKAWDYIQKQTTKGKTLASILEELEQHKDILKNTNKLEGFYSVEDLHKVWTNSVSKRVVRCDINTGEELEEYPSLYKAAKAMNAKNGAGNLGRACNNPNKTMYGYKWKFK